MKTVVTWALVSAALFVMVATAPAVQPANMQERQRPFLNVSTTPESLDLGTAPFTGPLQVDAAFTVKVDTNYALGPIYVSSTPLKHASGATIEPQNILVRTSATQGFIAMDKPVAISQPAIGPNKIVVDVKVLTKVLGPAGEYSGVFMFTITPPV
jgi:hypothetical protein